MDNKINDSLLRNIFPKPDKMKKYFLIKNYYTLHKIVNYTLYMCKY
jgi:hypothetical protein